MKYDRFKIILLAALLTGLPQFCSTAASGQPERISLAGNWRFELNHKDSGKDGLPEFSSELRIQLPGALQNQGFGEAITLETAWTGGVGYGGDITTDRWLKGPEYAKYRQPGNIKVPFFLQPERHYVGAAWYQREVEIPKAWEGRRVMLSLERAHWETRVWVDGKEIGFNNSLSTPHQYDLGTKLAPGKHALTIRVRNDLLQDIDVGAWASSVTDHTQGNWNGIIGRIELIATSPVWIDDAQVYPNVAKKSALLKLRIANDGGKAGEGVVTVKTHGRSTAIEIPVKWDEKSGSVEKEIPLGDDAQTWDEFHPSLQKISVQLKGEQADDQRALSFGLREIGVEGRDFILNGQKIFLRGTLECCIFPLTGYPPTDVELWKRLIRTCQAHGLNHIRFHSWCPPEAAFVAADELGFYLSVEVDTWGTVGDGKPIDDWIYKESERILQAYGNHPSFLLMAYGNEPAGKNHVAWLTQWVTHWKQLDSRRLYTTGSGYPAVPENQYHDFYNADIPCRGLAGWLGKDYRQSVQALTAPAIVHEMGQWCVYPNFDEMKKYTGPLKPKNFEIFRDSLTEHGMLNQARDFVRASGKLQVLCYKEEIEAALRTPGIGGFHLLDLHDFPGQGTAPVGVLDPFWESKGYVTAKEYSRFCNRTVPLARLLKRVWTTQETLTAEVEVAHFGPKPLDGAVATWKLVGENGKPVAVGQLTESPRTVPLGQGTRLGRIELNLGALATPKPYKLVVSLRDKNGTTFENDWKIWVYPAHVETVEPADVLVSTHFDAQTAAELDRGGKVLLLPATLPSRNPRLAFEPVFWCRYFFDAGFQTLGLLCDPKHPALSEFPTDFFQDFEWQEIVTGARAMLLDNLSKDYRPIVQSIDDWNSNRKLGLVWECQIGSGKLLVCPADLQRNLDQRPAARQLRASLLHYMSGKEFQPKLQLTKDILFGMLKASEPSKLAKLGAKVLEADSEDNDHSNIAANVIDGDPDTFWHTRWEPVKDPLPHYLIIDIGSEVAVKGITYLPRQDTPTGRIAEGEIYCSHDPKVWGEPSAKVKWPNTDQRQTVTFEQPVKTRYLKVLVRSEVNGFPFASLAELDIVTDEK